MRPSFDKVGVVLDQTPEVELLDKALDHYEDATGEQFGSEADLSLVQSDAFVEFREYVRANSSEYDDTDVEVDLDEEEVVVSMIILAYSAFRNPDALLAARCGIMTRELQHASDESHMFQQFEAQLRQ